MPDSTFFQKFTNPSKKEWFDLLGRAADNRIYTSESVDVPVFIHNSDGLSPPPIVSKRDNNWNIVATIIVKDLVAANTQAIQALEGGVDELLFVIDRPVIWRLLLKNIELPFIHLSCEVASQKAEYLMWSLNQYVALQGWNAEDLHGSWLVGSLNAQLMQSYLAQGKKIFPRFSLLSLRQKESLDQEIAFSKILLQIKDMYESTQDVEVLRKMRFRLLAENNILKTISGIRAFKLLWLQLQRQLDLPVWMPDIAVVLDKTHWQEEDNENRILATIQALAGIIGGCEHLIVPSIGNGDPFSERINRNISHILKMESYMDRVADPAAGSKVVEALTEAIASITWNKFIEAHI